MLNIFPFWSIQSNEINLFSSNLSFIVLPFFWGINWITSLINLKKSDDVKKRRLVIHRCLHEKNENHCCVIVERKDWSNYTDHLGMKDIFEGNYSFVFSEDFKLKEKQFFIRSNKTKYSKTTKVLQRRILSKLVQFIRWFCSHSLNCPKFIDSKNNILIYWTFEMKIME